MKMPEEIAGRYEQSGADAVHGKGGFRRKVNVVPFCDQNLTPQHLFRIILITSYILLKSTSLGINRG